MANNTCNIARSQQLDSESHTTSKEQHYTVFLYDNSSWKLKIYSWDYTMDHIKRTDHWHRRYQYSHETVKKRTYLIHDLSKHLITLIIVMGQHWHTYTNYGRKHWAIGNTLILAIIHSIDICWANINVNKCIPGDSSNRNKIIQYNSLIYSWGNSQLFLENWWPRLNYI